MGEARFPRRVGVTPEPPGDHVRPPVGVRRLGGERAGGDLVSGPRVIDGEEPGPASHGYGMRFSRVELPLAFVGGVFPLVGDPLAFVGDPVALVGGPVAFVGAISHQPGISLITFSLPNDSPPFVDFLNTSPSGPAQTM